MSSRKSDMLAGDERKLYKTLTDPVKCIRGVFGFDLWGKQAEIARSVVAHERTWVKACHASGKTAVAGRIAPWWLLRFPKDGKVITTAPTMNQVQRALWGEIHSALAKARESVSIPLPNLTELRLGEHWWMYGFSTNVQHGDEGVRFQGFHGGHLLIIFDEALGIHPSLFSSLEGVMSSGHVRFLGLLNPTTPSGPAYEAFSDADNNCITISAFDTPNFDGVTLDDIAAKPKDDPWLDQNPHPWLISRRWVWTRLRKWGRDHPNFVSRVLGRFPLQSKFAMFPFDVLESACREVPHRPDEQRVIGIDVAGEGDADTVLTLRSGGRLVGQWGFSEPDPRAAVHRLITALMPCHLINVDSIGIGYNFGLFLADTWGLVQNGGLVQLVNVGLPSFYPTRFLNLKAELYTVTSDFFKEGLLTWADSARSDDPNAHGPAVRSALSVGHGDVTTGSEAVDICKGQLVGLQSEDTGRGVVKMESKKDMKKRGVPSPDYAESLVLACCPNLLVTEGEKRAEYEDDEYVISRL